MPPQPQYPYGGRPPAAPGPYGSPYPQQQPYAQQPYPPQQPYPQQPYPPQPYPGWGGMPPVVPPPRKRRVGLVLGIVGGVVTLAVVGLVLLGTVAESGFPEARHKLTLPHTLLHGRYVFAEDYSATEGKKVEREADGAWDAKDIHAVTARYSLDGDATRGSLAVSGMYGRFKNQASVRRRMLKGAAEADGVTLGKPARDVAPPGADTPVSCEVLVQKSGTVTLTYPVCAWADGNTAAMIGAVGRERTDPAGIDLDAAARDALDIRGEMLKPVG
ncbi:hypothetical protein ACIQVT_09640 [Streptomyces sp. NPDC100445]|uniref:hypothetical protein n=1 Tax=Streptomyces sp. NPDC100445 TaxID=3366102 RepID=UPI003825127D